jgi:hypothetical protein
MSEHGRCHHTFSPLGVQCEKAAHAEAFACHATGVTDGVHWACWWWPTARKDQPR